MDAEDLREIPLFRDLRPREREKLARWADEVDLPAGKALIEQGSFPHEFFVLQEGTAEVLFDGEHLANLGPGDFFGEIALMEHHRRTATVVTTSAARVVVMASREFGAMERELPEVAERIRATMVARREEHRAKTGEEA
ncbi:MAG TPA: cyclic nucleotide-binding domain-containing protein [Actinomycetota bacterium]|nr:cyclic nucleotide-binding domain-containing protein [Actinomycetota bacterium]